MIQSVSYSYIVINSVMVLFGTSFIVAVLRQCSGKFKATNDLLCFFLVIASTVWSAFLVPVNIYIVSNDGQIDAFICAFNTYVLAFGIAILTSLHALLALDRWFHMVSFTTLRKRHMIALFLVVMALFSAIIIYSGTRPNKPFVLYESRAFCFFPAVADDITDKIGLIVFICFGSLCFQCIFMAYGYIFYKAKQIGKHMKHIKRNGASTAHYAILNRCVLVLGAMLFTWIPNIIAMLYRIISNAYINETVEEVISSFLMMDGITTLIILLITNESFREAYQSQIQWHDNEPESVEPSLLDSSRVAPMDTLFTVGDLPSGPRPSVNLLH